MHFLAHIGLAAGRSPHELGPLREAEDAAVKALVRQGLVTALFMRADRPGAALLMAADDEAAARSALAGLPAIKAGFIAVTEIIPLTCHAAHQDNQTA